MKIICIYFDSALEFTSRLARYCKWYSSAAPSSRSQDKCNILPSVKNSVTSMSNWFRNESNVKEKLIYC